MPEIGQTTTNSAGETYKWDGDTWTPKALKTADQIPAGAGTRGAGDTSSDIVAGRTMRLASAGSSPHQAFVQGLVDLGVSPEVAQGAISYASKNESGGDPGAVNPSSGASFYMQWLGPRKSAIIDKYGPSPSVEDQVSFMKAELAGPENLTLARLLTAKTGMEGYQTWGQSYERPGPLALMKAGALSPTGQPHGGLNIGSSADFSQIRQNALAPLGQASPSPEPTTINLNMGPAPEASRAEGPWARLMTLSLIQQLMSRGTHQFEPIEYDPFKVAQVAQSRRSG